MKSLIVSLFAVSLSLSLSCASSAKYAYQEADVCPVPMSASEHESGVVRCRAMCSSYARDFAEFDADCKCRCAPANGGGYRGPHQRTVPRQSGDPFAANQTSVTR